MHAPAFQSSCESRLTSRLTFLARFCVGTTEFDRASPLLLEASDDRRLLVSGPTGESSLLDSPELDS